RRSICGYHDQGRRGQHYGAKFPARDIVFVESGGTSRSIASRHEHGDTSDRVRNYWRTAWWLSRQTNALGSLSPGFGLKRESLRPSGSGARQPERNLI